MVKSLVENYEDKFIKIYHISSKPKTEVYEVWSKCSNILLGNILWYPKWRHYVFDDAKNIYSDRCLFALGEFVKKCNENHKRKA